MNVKELKGLLEEVEANLAKNNLDEIKRLELSILARQVEMQMLVGGFDPLADLDAITIIDLSQLKRLVQKVDAEIKNEVARRDLVDKILNLSRSGLKAAGLPVG